MRLRTALISTAMLLLPAAGAAQDAPQPEIVQPAEEAKEKPAATLASAADVRVPPKSSEASDAEPPKKRRAARVTTCRCGADAPQK